MGQAARSTSQEYWRPANPRLVETPVARAGCWRCGSDYSYGALYCHVCGSQRDPQIAAVPSPRKTTPVSLLSLAGLRAYFGLSVPSRMVLVIGGGCMIAA